MHYRPVLLVGRARAALAALGAGLQRRGDGSARRYVESPVSTRTVRPRATQGQN
jgi:hypothetical protein